MCMQDAPNVNAVLAADVEDRYGNQISDQLRSSGMSNSKANRGEPVSQCWPRWPIMSCWSVTPLATSGCFDVLSQHVEVVVGSRSDGRRCSYEESGPQTVAVLGSANQILHVFTR